MNPEAFTRRCGGGWRLLRVNRAAAYACNRPNVSKRVWIFPWAIRHSLNMVL